MPRSYFKSYSLLLLVCPKSNQKDQAEKESDLNKINSLYIAYLNTQFNNRLAERPNDYVQLNIESGIVLVDLTPKEWPDCSPG